MVELGESKETRCIWRETKLTNTRLGIIQTNTLISDNPLLLALALVSGDLKLFNIP